MKRNVAPILALCFAVALSPVFSNQAFAQTQVETQQHQINSEEADAIAFATYLMAYPLVLMELSAKLATNVAEPAGPRAPVNQFANLRRFPDPAFNLVVRPNADTLYSSLNYDVSKEPLIISVPAARDRYYLLQLMDMWSDVYASPGTRTTGNDAYTFALTAPGWHGKLPNGIRAYESPTDQGWLLGRIETKGKADYDAVHAFQDGLKAVPLSAWGTDYVPPKAIVDPSQDNTPPVDQIAKLDGRAFFTLFADAMKKNPPHLDDASAVDVMRKIGIVPGESFNLDAQPKVVQNAIESAPTRALPFISQIIQHTGVDVNGWRLYLSAIGNYGSDYLNRAGFAYGGLAANKPTDAVYPIAFVDGNGDKLDSSKRYVLHFDKEQIPPVRAFWSVTMYNRDQLFAKNPINRYKLGSNSDLKYNDDGSLDIYIQRQSPGAAKEANWLPTPANGTFSLGMRLYWPKLSVLNGQWLPPAIKRIES